MELDDGNYVERVCKRSVREDDFGNWVWEGVRYVILLEGSQPGDDRASEHIEMLKVEIWMNVS